MPKSADTGSAPRRVVVALFTKAPVAGEVKTRLAADIGEVRALEAHITLTEKTVAQLQSCERWELQLWSSGKRETAWLPELPHRTQACGDLGVRMSQAADHLLSRGAWPIIIGSDCPVMTATYVQSAIAALEAGADLVIGPAEDGGYVLIGMRRPLPEIFDGVTWSSENVLTETLGRANAAAASTTLLDVLWDVDTIADWRRWQNMLGT